MNLIKRARDSVVSSRWFTQTED